MFVVRPVQKKDLDELYKLSSLAKAGLTTFPHNKKVIRQRIADSVHDFDLKINKPNGETYFFVMEDTRNKKIVGTSAIISKIGGYEPSYTYEIKVAKKKSKSLKVDKEIQYLELKKEYDGPSEIGTLFLNPKVRQKGLGRMLSLSRFLFMAQYPKCFEKFVIAELRGIVDEDDCSPFWNAVCSHFFEMDFKKADLMVMEDKSFIADLIPQHPIYIPLLPKEAQDSIGRVHPNTEPAMNMLIQENFKVINEIDIFEAGPVVGTKVKNIRSVKKSIEKNIHKIVEQIDDNRLFLIANVSGFKKFRVTMGSVINGKKGFVIDKHIAKALKVQVNDKIRVVKMYG